MAPVYHIADAKDSRALSECLARNEQLPLPMVELMSSAQVAVEEFMDVLGLAALPGGQTTLAGGGALGVCSRGSRAHEDVRTG